MSVIDVARIQIADLPSATVTPLPRAGLRDAELDVDVEATIARLERHEEQRERPHVSEPEQLEYDLRAFIDSLALRFFSANEVVALGARVHASGVKNELPPRHLWGNLALALRYADEIRSVTGSPGVLTSFYRAPAYNRAVGGATRSLHVAAAATDIVPRAVTPRQWGDAARDLRGSRLSVPAVVDVSIEGTVIRREGLAIESRQNPPQTSFTVASGIGVYRSFTHTDIRGTNQAW